MKVSHFGGTAERKTSKELDTVLSMRYGSGVNEFWIYGEARNPCLAVLVSGEYAILLIFQRMGIPAFSR